FLRAYGGEASAPDAERADLEKIRPDLTTKFFEKLFSLFTGQGANLRLAAAHTFHILAIGEGAEPVHRPHALFLERVEPGIPEQRVRRATRRIALKARYRIGEFVTVLLKQRVERCLIAEKAQEHFLHAVIGRVEFGEAHVRGMGCGSAV